MNLDRAKLEQSYMVELHPKGGSQIRMVREVMADKRELLLRGQTPEWQEVAVCETYDQARKELAKIRKQMREAKASSAEAVAQVEKPNPKKQPGDGDHGFDQADDAVVGVHGPEKLGGTGQAEKSKRQPAGQPEQRGDEFDQDHGGSVA